MQNLRIITGTVLSLFFLMAPALAQNSNPDEKNETESSSGALELLFGKSDFEPDLEEIAKHTLGSMGNPVRADMPAGERTYLNRLICINDNRKPSFERIGSFGMGPYGHIIDGYDVKCKSVKSVTIYMDMYHPGFIEERTVPGFFIKPNAN